MIMKKIANCFIVIGIIVFVIGFYVWVFKAGLPYSDPSPEMIRKYMFYNRIGEFMIPTGFVLAIIGVFLKIFIRCKKK